MSEPFSPHDTTPDSEEDLRNRYPNHDPFTDDFLDAYRRLEKALKQSKRYGTNNPYENPILRFVSSAEGKRYKNALDLIREVRNLLVHSPKVADEYPITPSEGLYDTLIEILELVENPEPALSFAIRAEQIFKTTLHENALVVMRAMEAAGFSHVPVVFRKELLGVFSKTCVFSYLINNADKKIDSSLMVGDFSKYIDFNYPNGDYYEFVPKDIPATDVRDMFDLTLARRPRRLSAVFITENGTRNSKLCGMITPWDILKNTVPTKR